MKGYTKIRYTIQERKSTKARCLYIGKHFTGFSWWVPKDFTRSYHPDSTEIRIADWLLVKKLRELSKQPWHRDVLVSCILEGNYK